MPDKKPFTAFSRRDFFKGVGASAVASATGAAQSFAQELHTLNREQPLGPGPTPMTLRINGRAVPIEVDPGTTLLEALREHLDFTGAKEVCGRASCGACTVLIDGEPQYACMKLAVEAQRSEITTVEGLAEGDQLSALQEAFLEEDGAMCGYCTSGMLLSLTAFLKEHPKPTEAEVQHAISGNLCRCGTYPRVVQSALRAAGVPTTPHTEVIRWSHGQKRG